MKIIETDDTVMKVRLAGEDDIIIDVHNRVIWFTPLEAQQLSLLLKDLCSRTKYFQGLRSLKEKEKTKLLKDTLPDAETLFHLGNEIQNLYRYNDSVGNTESVHALIENIIGVIDRIRLACYGNSKKEE